MKTPKVKKTWRDRYYENRERYIENQKKYQRNHRAARLAYALKYKEKNRDLINLKVLSHHADIHPVQQQYYRHISTLCALKRKMAQKGYVTERNERTIQRYEADIAKLKVEILRECYKTGSFQPQNRFNKKWDKDKQKFVERTITKELEKKLLARARGPFGPPMTGDEMMDDLLNNKEKIKNGYTLSY